MRFKALTLSAVTVALLVAGCGGANDVVEQTTTKANGGGPTPGVSSSATSGTSDIPKEDSSFKDGVLATPKIRIVITNHTIIPVGSKGNEYGKKPVIAFRYKITNLSTEKVTPMNFLFSFQAFQDNNPNAENKLEVGALPDDKFLESQTETIKKGGTVENAVAYELDDQTTPVDLVASTDLGMTEIGKVTYKL